MNMKTCKKCLETKPETNEFFQHARNGKNGFNSRCKVCVCDEARKWAHSHPERIKERGKKYAIKRRDKVREYQRHYYRTKLKSDPVWRACRNIRRRAKEILKNGQWSRSLGCSGSELRAYLEAKFLPGMTWQNYGEWHIDHILPLSVAHARGPESFKEACHYTNLQPLWAVDNILKSDKVQI